MGKLQFPDFQYVGDINSRDYGGTWVSKPIDGKYYIINIENCEDLGMTCKEKYQVIAARVELADITEDDAKSISSYADIDWQTEPDWSKAYAAFNYNGGVRLHCEFGNNFNNLIKIAKRHCG